MKTTVLTSLTHVLIVVDQTLPTQLQRSAKLKIAHYQVFIFCQKKHLKQSFCYTSQLNDNRLMRCSSSLVNLVAFTNKECLTKILIIFRYANFAFPQLHCLKFHLNWLTFLEARKKIKPSFFLFTAKSAIANCGISCRLVVC